MEARSVVLVLRRTLGQRLRVRIVVIAVQWNYGVGDTETPGNESPEVELVTGLAGACT